MKPGRRVLRMIEEFCDGVAKYDATVEGMSVQERTLEQRLERSIAQADAGRLIDADDVLDELNRS